MIRGPLLAAGLLLACAPPGATGAGSQTPKEPAPGRPASELAGRVGEVLEASVPLLGGGSQALAELRGRPVLLELNHAEDPVRGAAQDRWRVLAQEQADAVTVVCVGLDAASEALPARWVDEPPPFVLGWDPQGALAARLQLVVLPTVILLDARGAIVSVHEGQAPDDAAIRRWLDAG